MNTETHSPLVPQGSLELKKNQGRARVKLVVSIVLAVHGIALVALLMAGCQKEKDPALDQAPPPPAEDQAQASPSTPAAPPLEEPSNAAPADTNPAVPATAATATPPPPPPPAPEPTAPAPAPLSAPAASTTQDYKIAAGDTFSTIAKHNHVTVKALMEANPNVSPTKLQIGQTIKLPAPTVSAPGATTSTVGGSGAEAVTGEANLYTVKSGDTLSAIAKRNHVSLRALRSANNLTTDRIKVGDKLKIPTKAAPAPTAAATTPPTQ